MFQTFEVTADPSQGSERVKKLRQQLDESGIDGFLVPRADEHQGEYVPACAERLSWLTGFTGSAGVAMILKERAILFVDGRYTLQAGEQTDRAIFEVESLVDCPPSAWIAEHLPKGARLGFDPWLHTVDEVRRLEKSVSLQNGTLVPLSHNPVDAIWVDRPAPPLEPTRIHPLDYAGELASEKLERLASRIADAGADFTVLTDPSSIAWAFNIRGADVPHTPLALAFALLSATSRPALFIDKRKLDRETEAYLTQLADLQPPSALESALGALKDRTLGLDPALAADQFRRIGEEAGATVIDMPDPARLLRALKNATELAGARTAHLRDGAALARFLCWLDSNAAEGSDEIGLVKKLEACRAETGEAMQMPLRDISFDTISGAGPNGAIIHYRVTTKTSRKLASDELYLVDSGAQYSDGTTDVTRTVIRGAPTAEMRDRYTRVLKGLIAVTLLRFPAGTRGQDIDPFARAALWQAGLDYAHGTGHGVGSYLSVHEGPQRLAKTGTEKLHAGMILSNEPGYYKAGHYGIRLENLIVVKQAEAIPDGDIEMHGFETLTLVPFDHRLIDENLLTPSERAWIDSYHRHVLEEIGPLVDGEVRAWLERATAPLSMR